MAGHSKFKNIMHRKGAQDKKRAKLFTRLVHDIITATKNSNPDPNSNPKLRAAILAAKKVNLPKDRIDNAIKKASSADFCDNYEEIRYEGYGPFSIPIIVEALTDNRNRTAAEIRTAFAKYNGNLGEVGSVSYMFEKIGILTFQKEAIVCEENLEEDAINAMALDYEEDEENYIIICSLSLLHQIKELLQKKYGECDVSITWRPKNICPLIKINNEEKEFMIKFLDKLEDSDDVQEVISHFIVE